MNKYKNAVETLISAQELIIKYSFREVAGNVVNGLLLIALASFWLSTIWLAALTIIAAGINFHLAFNEYQFYKAFKSDLELLKTIDTNNVNE